MINFVLTKGELTWQYRRSIETAKVHGEPIVLWHPRGEDPDVTGLHCAKWSYDIPDWLKDQPGAYIYDWVALDILVKYGGLVMGMDNISIRPALDLLGDYDICVSCDVPFEDYENQTRPIDHPFNNAYIGKAGTDIAQELFHECTVRLKTGQVVTTLQGGIQSSVPMKWGDTGPGLLTKPILDNPKVATWGKFPSMTGWEGSYIWKFYCGLEDPHPNTRIIHLFSSAYRLLYSGVPTAVEQWVVENPDFAWVLPNKMPEILRRPK